MGLSFFPPLQESDNEYSDDGEPVVATHGGDASKPLTDSCTVYVGGGLPSDIQEDQNFEHFVSYGSSDGFGHRYSHYDDIRVMMMVMVIVMKFLGMARTREALPHNMSTPALCMWAKGFLLTLKRVTFMIICIAISRH